MSYTSPVSLPIIDFSNLDPKPGSTEEWESVKSKVWKAIEEYGCFQALNRKTPLEVEKAFLHEIEELFELPAETKMRSASDKPFHSYYIRQPSNKTLHHIFTIDDANNFESIKNFSDALWANGKPTFNNTVQSMSKKASELGNIIRRMIMESLGLEKYLDEHMNSTSDILRFMKYESHQTSSEPQLALESHTDRGVISILLQNQVDGLEVQTRDDEWVLVKFLPNTFMVLVGESFLAWTNGRLPCGNHRVMVSGNKARHSAGWFTVFKAGYMAKAPEELVDEKEHPLLFKPFDFYEFLKFLQRPGASKSNSTLKDYCGV